MMKRYRKNQFHFWYNLIIPIFITVIGSVLASWLFLQYQKPQVVIYTDYYYQKINEVSVGEFYVINQGRQTDNKVTIIIKGEIPTEDFTFTYNVSSCSVSHSKGLTYVSFEDLKPNEGIETTFKIKTPDESFVIKDFNSTSGNIIIRPWIQPWWYFSKLQGALIALISTIVFALGFIIGLVKEDVIPD